MASTLITSFGLAQARKSEVVAQQERDVAEAATAFMVGLFRAAEARQRLTALQAARYHAEQALRVDTATLEADHPNRGLSLMLVGQLEHRLGNFTAADAALSEALGIVEQRLGRDHQYFTMIDVELGRGIGP